MSSNKIVPKKTTRYLEQLMQKSEFVRMQFEPSKEELSNTGFETPWTGKIVNPNNSFERIYYNRAIILSTLHCAANCRHCIRKNYSWKKEPDKDSINQSIKYIREHNELNEILITGGDPFTNPKRLKQILKQLININHIRIIRIGTRFLTSNPLNSFRSIEVIEKFNSFKKPIEISPQFNHPDEITPEVKKVVEEFYKANIKLYNQTVLLKNINDDAKTLIRLYEQLRYMGIENHYLYHCAPVSGVQHFRTSVQKGLELKKIFREGYLSGRANPQYIVLTDVGKVELGIDSKIIKKKNNIMFILTPYKMSTFKKISPEFRLPTTCFENKEGYIIAQYLDGKD